ncbi:hypothetical protein CJF31_00011268 [Rutstroemia sp. NJR-2017a BVV2]|nr:hypothetical protein CJF31_00011268 [Rutstroemia sp. NJR-2017a BVV2]
MGPPGHPRSRNCGI